MSDYERTMELVNIAYDAQGRSSQQFAKYADSVEYSVKKLANTWEQFRVGIANNTLYKDVIDLLNGLLERISDFSAWDWSKLFLMFATVGRTSIHSFLNGAQKAISDISPALTKNLVNSLPEKMSQMTTVQKFALTNPNGIRARYEAGRLAKADYNQRQVAYSEQIQKSEERQNEIIKEQIQLNQERNKVINSNEARANELKAQMDANVEALTNEKKAQEELQKVQANDKVVVSEQNRAQASLNVLDEKVMAAQMQTVGSAAGVAFTTAFTTSMMTDDPGIVLKSTLASGAIAAIPGIINTFNAEMQRQGSTLGSSISAGLGAGIKGALVALAIAAVAAGLKQVSKMWHEHNEEVLEAENGYYRATKKLEKLKEQEEELGNEAYKASAQAEKTSKAYDDLASKVKELEKLRGKILLTADESERLVEISNEIADIAPELVSQYDAEGNAVIALKDSYEELLEAKREVALHDQLEADEAARDLAKKQLEEALVAKEQAQALYEQTHGQNGQLEKNLQYFVDNPFLAGNDAEEVFYKIYEASLGTDIAQSLYGAETKRGEFLVLNHEEEAELGTEIKRITKDLADFDFLQKLNDDEVVDAYREWYYNLSSTRQAEVQEELIEAIENVSNDYTQLDFAIKGAIDAYVEANKKVVETKLQQDSELYNAQEDRNVKDIMQRYVLQSANLTEEEIKKQAEAKNIDITKPEEFQDFINKLMEDIEIDEDALSKKFTESVIDTLSQLSSIDMSLPEIEKFLSETLDEELLGVWAEQRKIDIEAYNKNVEQLTNITGKGTIDKSGYVYTNDDQLIQTLMKAQYIDDFVEKLNTWSNVERTSDFLDIIGSVDPDTIVKIFNVNWDQVAVAEYSAMIDSLAKAANTDRNKIEDIVKALNLFDYIPTNIDEFKESIDERFKEYDKYDKKIKALQTAGDSWAKDGKVSAAGIEAIYDAGFKVSDLVDDNLQFNAEKAKAIIEEELKGEKDSLELQKQKIQLSRDALLDIQKYTGTYTAEWLKANGVSPDQIEEYFYKTEDGLYKQRKQVVQAAIDSQTEILDNYDSEIAALIYRLATLGQEMTSAAKGWEEALEEANEKITKAQEEVQKAYEDVLKKQQDVIDKQEALNKTLYGDENRKSKLDNLYNYTTAFDTFKEQVNEAKEALDNLEGRDPSEFLENWASGIHKESVNLQAQNERLNAAINSTEDVLKGRLTDYLKDLGRGIDSNVSDYYKYNADLDRYEIDSLSLAQMPNEIKDFIEEQVDLMNQYKKNIKKNQDDIKQLEKDFKDYQEKVRDDYISIQDSIAKTLEEYYEKQIEDKKEMYEALEEADNEYLDALEKAIDKERKLRDKQNKWQDLATKEKKLSLMQRDTSGANQKQTQSLQKEIEKDRQSLLDDAVDSIVNNLKELYETQQETREIEIKYQESLLKNADYIAEANQLLQSWKTVDQMREWMWDHTKDIDKMSDEAVEKLTQDWADMFDTIVTYNEMSQLEVSDIFDTTSQEVRQIVFNTSELLTSEADRAFGEVSENVTKAITDAEQAVTDAMKALADAQQTYNEKLAEFNRLVVDYNDIMAKAAAALGAEIPESHEVVLEGAALNAYNQSQINHVGQKSMEEIIKEANSQKQTEQREIEQGETHAEFQIQRTAIQWLQNNYPDLIAEIETSGFQEISYNKELVNKLIEAGYRMEKKDNGNYIVYKEKKSMIEVLQSSPKAYIHGGLVNYTGLAQVDGTPSKPEAFLNAEDTARIGEAADIFASFASFGTNRTLTSALSQTIGDTNAQVNIYVDSIATPDQVDYLLDRVKEEFVEVANPIGAAVILRQ